MKPILMNTEMVRAILEGKKTVTRRVVKPQPESDESGNPVFSFHGCSKDFVRVPVRGLGGLLMCVPPYRPGDILYVRETWSDMAFLGYQHSYKYKADQSAGLLKYANDIGLKWRPSIHMPREAARLFLRVTDVRVERLQDITPAQLRAEGMRLFLLPSETSNMMNRFGSVMDYEQKLEDFSRLWDSTIKPADRALYGWDANPWVWVISFERIGKEEALNGHLD